MYLCFFFFSSELCLVFKGISVSSVYVFYNDFESKCSDFFIVF